MPPTCLECSLVEARSNLPVLQCCCAGWSGGDLLAPGAAVRKRYMPSAIPRTRQRNKFASIPSPDEAGRILQAKGAIVKGQDKKCTGSDAESYLVSLPFTTGMSK